MQGPSKEPALPRPGAAARLAIVNEQLTAKELAARLRKHTTYIYAMTRRGFPMPDRTATLQQALDWLTTHPQPRGRLPYQKPKGRVPPVSVKLVETRFQKQPLCNMNDEDRRVLLDRMCRAGWLSGYRYEDSKRAMLDWTPDGDWQADHIRGLAELYDVRQNPSADLIPV